MKLNFVKLFLLIFFTTSTFASVMVNQAGYLPGAQKIFFATTAADSFTISPFGSSTIVFKGALAVSKANDAATGITVYKGDFSSFTQSGAFTITTTSAETSAMFIISSSVFSDVAAKSLKGFYFQRCGVALDQTYAGVYKHAACHINDGTFHSTTDTTGTKDETGGWHDAGDFGKYIVNAGVSVGTLLMAYESFPEKFSADNTNIPESGNSIPDILDESQFEIRWMMKMQHWSGGVYFKLTREQFEGFVMPQADNTTRYIYQLSTTATGDLAAVCARAARVFAPFDKPFADSCLEAATRAWNYLQTHSSILPSGGFKNPSGTATGEYGDGNDPDERLWAAAELFATTDGSEFSSYYSLHYSGTLLSQPMSWPNVSTMANLTYLFSQQPSASSTIQTALRTSLLSYAASLSTSIAAEGFKVAIKSNEYWWGSNSEVLNRAIMLIYAYKESNNKTYVYDALSQLNYILGCNIHGKSFITGVGTNSVMHPHHRPSGADGITAPVPGLLAGGPDKGRDDAVLQSHYTASTPSAICYIDDQGSYASNEIAINWNAPLVLVAGFFAHDDFTSSVFEQQRSTPLQFELQQNYPNPFNPATTIRFALNNAGFTTLKVIDTLGKEIAILLTEYLQAGSYSAKFNADKFSSGIYFYNLTSGKYSSTKKMILVK